MAKRLLPKQILEIIELFTLGKNIDELSKEFNCTKLTITRNLKKSLGEGKYKELSNKKYPKESLSQNKGKEIFSDQVNDFNSNKKVSSESNANENLIADQLSEFMEITPLNCEIENEPQKDLSSKPISEVDLPKIVYMIVDKNIEMEIKILKDHPDWQFLSREELDRKTIEIYFDLKIAKKFCRKDQKVIKVPNTNVFKIVAPILISRGISRIVSPDNLISL